MSLVLLALLAAAGVVALALRFRGTGESLPRAVHGVLEALTILGATLFVCYIPVHFLIKFW